MVKNYEIKVVGTKACNVVAHLNVTSIFGMNFWIDFVGGIRIKVAVGICRHLQ